MLLVAISDPETARKKFLCDLFSVILNSAVSTFDFNDYSTSDSTVRQFYKQALAHHKDSASDLLLQLVKKASSPTTYKSYVQTVLKSLMKELMDTASLEVQPWLELLVKAYITKAAGKPSKLDDGACWEGRVKFAKQELQELPKLKQALGNETYIRLIGSAGQVADKAQPLSQSKRKKSEDTDAEPERTSKHARRGGEQNEV
jgi:hypothetical protein